MGDFLKKPCFYLLIVLSLAFVGFGRSTILRAHAGARGQSGAAWAVTQVGDELRIAFGSGVDTPQYAVLHLDSGYFRLVYGPSSGWGTSIVIPPAFWSAGIYYQGTPVNATWQITDSHLMLSLTGTIHGLELTSLVDLTPPGSGFIAAHISTTLAGSLPLDDRPGEAFKPVMLSSMNQSSAVWDAQAAFSDCRLIALPESGWVIPPQPQWMAQSFGLVGGSSAWKTNAPTLRITLDQPRQLAGWVTPSSDPNDDNVGLWAASDVILPSWSYRVVASSGNNIKCAFQPLVARSLPTPEPTATPTSPPLASDCRVNKLSGTTNPEYVIIKNFGPGAQDMTGWTLVSVVGPQTFLFPAGYVLNPGATVRIESYTAATDNPPAVLLWTHSAVWSNTGEKAQLVNPAGEVVSWKCYGNKCP